MKRLLIIFVLAIPGQLPGIEPANDPNLAVVRIKSHGASGTVVATTDGKSWILSCAHMFFDLNDNIDPRQTSRKITIDGPVQPYAPKKLAPVRIIGIDPDQDISLLEIDNGPFNYIPVAKKGYKLTKHIRSAGYDEMKWPITNREATILVVSGDWTYTREKPWHGRSGGGLIDVQGRCLIGIVNGYENMGQHRGIYVSHQSVLRFLSKYQGARPQAPARPPEPTPYNRYSWEPFNKLLPCPQGQ